MDINVDTQVFEEFKNNLKRCSLSLTETSNTLSQNVKLAGESLAGRQYALSVQETDASCKIIDASVENLEILGRYLGKLEEHVKTYLNCKYEG